MYKRYFIIRSVNVPFSTKYVFVITTSDDDIDRIKNICTSTPFSFENFYISEITINSFSETSLHVIKYSKLPKNVKILLEQHDTFEFFNDLYDDIIKIKPVKYINWNFVYKKINNVFYIQCEIKNKTIISNHFNF